MMGFSDGSGISLIIDKQSKNKNIRPIFQVISISIHPVTARKYEQPTAAPLMNR